MNSLRLRVALKVRGLGFLGQRYDSLCCDGAHSAWDWADPGGTSGSALVVVAAVAGEAVAMVRERRARRVTFSMGKAGAHRVPIDGGKWKKMSCPYDFRSSIQFIL